MSWEHRGLRKAYASPGSGKSSRGSYSCRSISFCCSVRSIPFFTWNSVPWSAMDSKYQINNYLKIPQTNLLFKSAHSRRRRLITASTDQLLFQSAQFVGIESEEQIANKHKQFMKMAKHFREIFFRLGHIQGTFGEIEKTPESSNIMQILRILMNQIMARRGSAMITFGSQSSICSLLM